MKCYVVKLSDKSTISIDEDELETVLSALGGGALVKCRQGVFNPSYFVALVEDEDRVQDYISRIQHTFDPTTGTTRTRYPEPRKLADIFAQDYQQKRLLQGDDATI